jgi:lipoprotein-releasing system ATP-binding protein
MSEHSAPVLSLRGVDRTYKIGDGELQVLKAVDLDVRPGEIVGLIGPSGSGKSSLLHAAGLLERPTAGRVTVDGVECSGLKDIARTRLRLRTIGFIYQFHHLLPEFTALDNVALPQMIAGKSQGQARARAKEMLDRLGLGERLTHQPAQAASNSVSPSPAPSPINPSCSWPTSPRAISTPPPPARCSRACSIWPESRAWPV